MANQTYKEAQARILAYLESAGWGVSKNLKVPHATPPDGGARVYFKTQAVYLSVGNIHNLGGALSMWCDIHELTGPQFVAAVERWREAVARKEK